MGTGILGVVAGRNVPCQMPIAVKSSIQIRVTFHRVAFSGNHGFGTLFISLSPYDLAVIVLVRNDRLRSRSLGNRRMRPGITSCVIIAAPTYAEAAARFHSPTASVGAREHPLDRRTDHDHSAAQTGSSS